jgi:hypothetical protein
VRKRDSAVSGDVFIGAIEFSHPQANDSSAAARLQPLPSRERIPELRYDLRVVQGAEEIRDMRGVVVALSVASLAGALPAAAQVEGAFPRERLGASLLVTTGGGTVAGDTYVTRSAAVVWSRRWNTLTLYLFWRRNVTCRTLLRAVQLPGHLVQVHVTSGPRLHVGRPMPDSQVAFLTIYRNPSTPEHVAGLRHGARLTFESVDSNPGGVWRGRFSLPTRIYGDGNVYGYSGTFAARFCEVSSLRLGARARSLPHGSIGWAAQQA